MCLLMHKFLENFSNGRSVSSLVCGIFVRLLREINFVGLYLG
jgi:hypothetical protein